MKNVNGLKFTLIVRCRKGYLPSKRMWSPLLIEPSLTPDTDLSPTPSLPVHVGSPVPTSFPTSETTSTRSSLLVSLTLQTTGSFRHSGVPKLNGPSSFGVSLSTIRLNYPVTFINVFKTNGFKVQVRRCSGGRVKWSQEGPIDGLRRSELF